MIFEHSNYRSFLKEVLVERKRKNEAYSLRAMARDLDLRPSHLSDIQKGSKNISLQNAYAVAVKLGLNTKQTDYFVLLVQLEQAKTPQHKESILSKLNLINGKTEVRDLSVDMFKIMADWYHIPIVEMTALDDFDFTPRNIAERLDISIQEVELALERLERLEMLEKDEDGRYHKTVSNYVFKSNKPNPALRQFHHQMMSKAQHSLTTQTPEEKYVGSQTFSIDVNQLGEARNIIEECRAKLVELFNRVNRAGKRTETYHFGVQLFKLTKGRKKK